MYMENFVCTHICYILPGYVTYDKNTNELISLHNKLANISSIFYLLCVAKV